MAERPATPTQEEVEIWPNGIGLDWNTHIDKRPATMQWLNNPKLNSFQATFRDGKYPSARKAIPDEILSFTVEALKQMPENKIVREMASQAISALTKNAYNLLGKTIIISELLAIKRDGKG